MIEAFIAFFKTDEVFSGFKETIGDRFVFLLDCVIAKLVPIARLPLKIGVFDAIEDLRRLIGSI